jgi:class 3 adenylate cyclase/tetratricopeptide (TPR) repeat protein
MIYLFEDHSLDSDRRELRRRNAIVAVEPQVFDILQHLIGNRGRVVSKDDLLAEVWNGRIVSESTLSSRIAAVRHAIGDSGDQQRLIRTIARKGFRFVGEVREEAGLDDAGAMNAAPSVQRKDAVPALPERRHLTIMACSMVGVVALASRLDPEDLREVIAEYYDCVTDVIGRYGGFVARHTGDGVLAYFGYPRAHEDDAERAVRAGLAVTRAVSELGSQRIAEPLRARVGIATGLVVVGDMDGVDTAPEHAVVGETPHLATRLLDASEPGMVAICAGTRELIGNLFDYRDLGTLPSKGTAEPSRAWQVVRENAVANRFEALRPGRAPLIGRDEELDLLLRRWNQAKTGEGRVILVWGEPGIGKSHLVAALADALEDERHSCLRFFCSPHRAETALHPVIAQLEDAAGFSPGDSNDVKLDKLARLLAPSSQYADQDVALFAELLSIATAGRYAPLSISAQRRKELLLERFIAQLAGLAAREPVLMILEDAHWVDPTTRELFDVVIDRVRGLPVLFIMTYRPEFVPSWLGQSHVTALTLNRLGRRENAALVKRVAGGKDLPPALLDQITTQTDGVPLFIEEVTKSVLESGILREEGGVYVLAGPLPLLAVPSTLQASLIARLDRLAPVRALVQTSAALGREFTYAVLKAVTALPDAELELLLGQLVASELVRQRGTVPHATYIFKHALVQDAAYETMLKSQRARIHDRIVEVFEHEFPEITERHPDVLAYHCREAGLWAKAIDFSIKAASMARERSAGVEAQSMIESAMTLLPGIPAGSARQQLEGRLQFALGDALTMTRGFASPEVMPALSRARALLDEMDHESIRALGGLFNYHLIRSESPLCLALTEPFLKRPLDRPNATVIHYLVGTAYLHLGNFRDSIRHLETALSLYDEEDCRSVAFVAGIHLHSFTLIWLGLSYLYAGSLQRASETILAAVKDARSRSHPFTLVSALLAQARFLNQTHDLQGAIEATDEGLAIATEQRSPYHLSRANVLRAVNLVESGRAEEGIALMEHALVAHRKTGANFQSSYNLSRLAEAHARAGKIERAMELAEQAVAEVSRTGERWWEAEAQRSRGEILLLAAPDHHDEAERCFSNALACARRQEAKLWELYATRSLANLWLAQGRRDDARELLALVYGTFTDGFETADLRLAKEFLERLDRPVRRAGRRGNSALS